MKKTKRILTLFIAVLFVVCSAVPALAASYEITGADIQLNLPEGTFVFTPTTENDDPTWVEAGITNPVELKTMYNDVGYSAHFSANENKDNVYFARKQTEVTSYYYNLDSLNDEEMAKFLERYDITEGTMHSSASIYSHNQVPFVRNLIWSDYVQQDSVVYELVYFTIVNGYSVAFSIHSEKEITEVEENYLKSIVDGAVFTNILPTPEKQQANPVLAITIIVGFVLVIVGLIVFFKMRKKHKKAKIRLMADKLSKYRALKRTDFGTVHFANDTDHSPEAIKAFALFQNYNKGLIKGVVSILFTGLATFISYQMDAEWWVSLILVAGTLYCAYRFLTGAGTIEKTLSRVYKKLKSTKAHYEFYSDEFTISGMQSREVFPYFQITDIRENNEYFYIYFGEDNTYFVKKSGFTAGNSKEFMNFIKEKRVKE